jgi:V8-like Glu-specific endopeptidase
VQIGPHDGSDFETIVQDIVRLPARRWVRVRLADARLGAASYVVLRSVQDGQWQRHDAASLPVWSNCSAVFNGDAVEIELHVAPGDSDVFVAVDRIWEPKVNRDAPAPGGSGTRSLCDDDDDRVPSDDSRVGRIWFCGADRDCSDNTPGGCTGWLVANGAALTAGHCPIQAADLIEFDVSPSTPNGRAVAGDPNRQYPIIAVQSQNGGAGLDWAVFTLGPNSTTGLRAHIAQGWFRMTDIHPAEDDTIRITGFGLDNRPAGTGGANADCCDFDDDGDCDLNCNSASQTRQTSSGRYDAFAGTIHEYVVDTLPGNSGGPIIWEDWFGWTIGIHTHGGCDSILDGFDNEGTAFALNALEDALNDVWSNVVYVDSAPTPIGLIEIGRVFRPFRDVAGAVAAVPDGGTVYLVPASYPAASGNVFTAGDDGKAMTFLAFVGAVTIGD